jgi:hypothetical protein
MPLGHRVILRVNPALPSVVCWLLCSCFGADPSGTLVEARRGGSWGGPGSPFEYDLVRLIYTKKREFDVWQ